MASIATCVIQVDVGIELRAKNIAEWPAVHWYALDDLVVKAESSRKGATLSRFADSAVGMRLAPWTLEHFKVQASPSRLATVLRAWQAHRGRRGRGRGRGGRRAVGGGRRAAPGNRKPVAFGFLRPSPKATSGAHVWRVFGIWGLKGPFAGMSK